MKPIETDNRYDKQKPLLIVRNNGVEGLPVASTKILAGNPSSSAGTRIPIRLPKLPTPKSNLDCLAFLLHELQPHTNMRGKAGEAATAADE